jgi:hypothetical protein
MEELRAGFEVAVYNSRGVHTVDPTGAPEMNLAASYSQKAETIENAGYFRFAGTFRAIADHYKRDAEGIRSRYAHRNRS